MIWHVFTLIHPMRTQFINLIPCLLLACGNLSGADGVSPAWTQIAEADRTLMGDYEVQILNSYGLHGYWNECGALYKTSPPQVNAARPPMEWQTYDIDYTAAVWKDGRKISPPRITVRHNGILIHKDAIIPHATSYSFPGRSSEPQGHGPLRLQDHNNALQFRNIWVTPLEKN
jgi:hypothetical protein